MKKKILNVALPPGAPLIYANDTYPPGGVVIQPREAGEPGPNRKAWMEREPNA